MYAILCSVKAVYNIPKYLWNNITRDFRKFNLWENMPTLFNGLWKIQEHFISGIWDFNIRTMFFRKSRKFYGLLPLLYISPFTTKYRLIINVRWTDSIWRRYLKFIVYISIFFLFYGIICNNLNQFSASLLFYYNETVLMWFTLKNQ